LTLIEAYEESPAIKAGLLPGDQILKVNGEETKGKKNDDVRTVMRGAPGTPVYLEVLKYGASETTEVVVEREEINIPNVPHYEVLEGEIAYVHLTKFTNNAGSNIRKAIKEMKKDADLNGIILDLRDNGGGLLREAIAVTNIFVDKDEEIVSTKGKVFDRDRIYKTLAPALDTSIAVVVLINKRSASASEIVSGAIQDLDRGVLIGQKSYGKGLVQNTKKVGYNSQVKLTTSKYYIPSGRCIQSVAYDNGEPVDIPDAERKAFSTRKGRKVLDGGGVQPDIKLVAKKQPEFVGFLIRENVIFKFVNDFYINHDSIPPVEDFDFDDFASFKNFYLAQKLEYNSALKNKFNSFKESYEKENPGVELNIPLDKYIPTDNALIEKYKTEILQEIENEIVGRYYYVNGKVRQSLKKDEELNEAIALLNDMETYNSILNGGE